MKKKTFIVLIIIAVIVISGITVSVLPKVLNTYKTSDLQSMANSYMNLADYENALYTYERLIELNGDDIDVYAGMVTASLLQAYAENENIQRQDEFFAKAMSYAKKINELFPDSEISEEMLIKVYMSLANNYMARREFADAGGLYSEVVELDIGDKYSDRIDFAKEQLSNIELLQQAAKKDEYITILAQVDNDIDTLDRTMPKLSESCDILTNKTVFELRDLYKEKCINVNESLTKVINDEDLVKKNLERICRAYDLIIELFDMMDMPDDLLNAREMCYKITGDEKYNINGGITNDYDNGDYIEYNCYGKVTFIRDRYGDETTYKYDGLREIKSEEIDSDGDSYSTTQNEYDDGGRLIRRTYVDVYPSIFDGVNEDIVIYEYEYTDEAVIKQSPGWYSYKFDSNGRYEGL